MLVYREGLKHDRRGNKSIAFCPNLKGPLVDREYIRGRGKAVGLIFTWRSVDINVRRTPSFGNVGLLDESDPKLANRLLDSGTV